MFPRTNLVKFQTPEGHKPLILPVYTFIYDSIDKVGICGEMGCSAEVCSLRVLFSSLLNHICWVLLFSYTDSVDPSKTGYWSEKFVTIFCRIAGGMLSTCVLNVWYTHICLTCHLKSSRCWLLLIRSDSQNSQKQANLVEKREKDKI